MQEQKKTSGGISVETEHIFPVIKKWLYSEKEIFLRELVSNACDAVTKLKRLSSLGEYDGEGETYRITVSFSAEEKTLTVSDNGIGMSREELERYLCRIAISGALDFIARYEGEGDQQGSGGIIGHFGLGFYSAFMVADAVEVISASYAGGETTRWICDEGGRYDMETASEARPHGTSVILHLGEEGEEYLSEGKLRAVLNKYCAFMPTEIYLENEDEEEKTEEKESLPVNDTEPLWQKRPSDCTDEEYKAFYHKVFEDGRDPLFYLHINADYPLNFKGVLYVPKLREQYESLEGKVKLYYNQVFVSDNVKEVIPEYLLMLRGVLDCPELPLNVSRSYLQNNTYVSRVSAHIVKKVADKLNAMLNTDREAYERIWRDIRTFVFYGCVSDRKFYDRVIGSVLLPLTDGSCVTLDEYFEGEASEEKCVYYATDEHLQAQYIAMLNAEGKRGPLLPTVLDARFAETVERNREKTRFLRVDADTSALTGEGEIEDEEALKTLFASLSDEKNPLKIEVTVLKDESVPALIKVQEDSRRMQDMMRMYAPDMPAMPSEETLVLNAACPLVRRLAQAEDCERRRTSARLVYRLAQLSGRTLNADEMKSFLADAYTALASLELS